VKPVVETVDLSHLSDASAQEFKRETALGAAGDPMEGGIKVLLNDPEYPNSGPNCWVILVDYYGPEKPYGEDHVKFRTFERVYPLEAVPAQITRGLVRLGAPKAFMHWLEGAYAEILEAVRPG
jgi:hypothetical protein